MERRLEHAQRLFRDLHAMKILLSIALLLLANSARAATNTAATVARADVLTAYNACANGDTLEIPAGAASWSSAITVAKAIRIIGAGTNSTIITNAAFILKPATNLLTRLSGIFFAQAD